GTIAVLGCGVDVVYPRSNAALAERLAAGEGLLLSEQPPGAQLLSRNLVARNRLRVGLSCACRVYQTDVQGGTMHTVRFAAQQAKPVFCPKPPGYQHPGNRGLRVLLEEPV